MPIKPENRRRYPPNWKAISLSIRRDRAKGRCECLGECGVGHGPGPDIYSREIYREFNEVAMLTPGRCDAWNTELHPVTGSRVVLTVAHLDHTPENCDPTNLRAMCQRCHLAYDREHHAKTRAENKRRKAVEDGQLSLLGPTNT